MRGCACRGTAGFAHVSCLAEQAKILVAEAEENNLGLKALDGRWARWYSCSLCEQDYHGLVACALGWACWKTYVGRPETDWARRKAMTLLGNGLSEAKHHKDELIVVEAELAVKRRIGDSERNILIAQGNLAITYQRLGRHEESLRVRQEVYSGRLMLDGEEHVSTLIAANNYAVILNELERFEEARSLLHKAVPAAHRVLGETNDITLMMRCNYAEALYAAEGATLNDIREAVTTLEETVQTARRVLGGAHPDVTSIEGSLEDAQEALAAREGTKIK